MAKQFRCPTGTVADAAELEYISALHQSADPNSLRSDGSIIATDVKNYLMSRHGIEVTEEEVESKIFHGLSSRSSINRTSSSSNGDDDDNNNEELLDITEIVSILLIPHLLQLSTTILPEKHQNLESDDLTSTTPATSTRLVQDVLNRILETMGSSNDSTSTTTTTTINLDTILIKKILISYGEIELSNNDILVKQMLYAATSNSNTALNEEAFIRALTSDVEKYDIQNGSTSHSSHFYDVFKTNDLEYLNKTSSTTATTTVFLDEENNNSLNEELLQLSNNNDNNITPSYPPVKIVPTSGHIDNQADAFKSKLFNTILWVNYTVSFFAYFLNADSTQLWQCHRSNEHYFFCLYGLYIAYFGTQFLLYSLIGAIYICFSSLGNGARSNIKHERIYVCISIMTIFIFNILTYFIEIDISVFSTVKQNDSYTKNFCYLTSFVLGWFLIALRILNLFDIMEDVVSSEVCIKQAACFKINQMVDSAHQLIVQRRHRNATPIQDDNIMLNYVDASSETKPAGGILLTIKGLYKRTLYTEEGIWISSRVISCFYSTSFVIIACALVGSSIIQKITPLPVNDGLIRDETTFILCAVTGTIIAMINATYLAIVLIPSAITQTLQFRYGIIPTLTDNHKDCNNNEMFLSLRRTVESVCILFPCSFWGPLISSLCIGFIIFAALYVIISVAGTTFGEAFYSQIFAVITIAALSYLLFLFLRKTFFIAFYRKHVRASNIFIVVVQCWYVGISIFFTISRFIKLATLAFVYAGRYDCLFLAPGVDVLNLDKMPMTFMKDILIHEAHRHPYIERLGAMYMMKLRHEEKFANTAGSTWRLLFVFALMPWLRKYRIHTRPESEGSDDDINMKLLQQETKEDDDDIHPTTGFNDMQALLINVIKKPRNIRL